MKFVGVREFKQDAVRYLNEGNEIVVMKRKKPIARLTPIEENSPEALLLDIGRVLNEAGVTKEEALIRRFSSNSFTSRRWKYSVLVYMDLSLNRSIIARPSDSQYPS